MKKLVFAIISVSMLMSCAPTETFVDTSCPGYKSVDFTRECSPLGK